MLRFYIAFLFFILGTSAVAQESAVKVGVPTLLSGDWAGLGDNIVKTVETYKRYYSRHPMEFVFDDAKISGMDGLKSYQHLINVEHVDVLIGATSSNGTMAGAPLINSSKTVMITPVTGGSNVDGAGEWIFRIGNSDVLNGTKQAEIFLTTHIKRVALVSEETEYTQDISKHFRNKFEAGSGQVVYTNDFPPNTTDFQSIVVSLKSKSPEAIFFTSQTGTSLSLFLLQLDKLGGFSGQIHTTFTAADNPDANAIAKGKFKGLHYLAPAYDKESDRLKKFLKLYRDDHGKDPLIPFHTAGTVDALDLLQAFLDTSKEYDGEAFRQFLLNQKDYHGLMGIYSFDAEGNANTGFVSAQIK